MSCHAWFHLQGQIKLHRRETSKKFQMKIDVSAGNRTSDRWLFCRTPMPFGYRDSCVPTFQIPDLNNKWQFIYIWLWFCVFMQNWYTFFLNRMDITIWTIRGAFSIFVPDRFLWIDVQLRLVSLIVGIVNYTLYLS